MRNIANFRATLQEAVTQIDATRQGITEVTQAAIRETEAKAQDMKNRARAQLQTTLADIGKEKGFLQSRKMEMVMEAMNNYRDYIRDVNTRNTQFQQKLFLQRDQADAALKEKLAGATSQLQKLQFKTFEYGGKQMPISFQPATGEAQYLGTQLGIYGGKGIGELPEEEEPLFQGG